MTEPTYGRVTVQGWNTCCTGGWLHTHTHTHTPCLSQYPCQNINQSIIYFKSLIFYFPSLCYPLTIPSNQLPIVFASSSVKDSIPPQGIKYFHCLVEDNIHFLIYEFLNVFSVEQNARPSEGNSAPHHRKQVIL